MQFTQASLLSAACAASALAQPQTPARSSHIAVESEFDGRLLLAAGDRLRLVAYHYDCVGDDCMIRQRVAVERWESRSPAIASVQADGVVRGLAAGHAIIVVHTAARSDTAAVVVLPPVKTLSWSTNGRSARVGDTLRIAAVARDSSGRIVARIGAAAHIRGTGMSGEVLSFDDHGYTVLKVDAPGLLVLAARLAHRTDTLRMTVAAAPRPRRF
jgi:hypothetical protein